MSKTIEEGIHPIRTLVILALLLATPMLFAADDRRTDPLSPADKAFMKHQRQELDDIARAELGRQFSGEPEQDIAILQELLDRNLVRRDQTELLQGMGVILGNLVAEKEDLQWVVYIDRKGRSRALTTRKKEEFIFPVTMISRRVEAGIDVNVEELYQKALGMARNLKGRIGFQ